MAPPFISSLLFNIRGVYPYKYLDMVSALNSSLDISFGNSVAH